MRAVLAYDASEGAQQAASLVEAMSWPRGSAVRVIAVIEPLATMVPGMPATPARLVYSPEIDAQISDYIKDEVDQLVQRLKTRHLDVEGDVVRGRPASVLLDEAKRFAAELMVAGSRGRGPIASLVLGSVSAELVDQAPCPVLVARGAAAKRVLFASDGSSAAGHAEEVLVRWPIFGDTTLRVLSVAEVVQPWHTGIAPMMYEQVVEAYAKDLTQAKAEHEGLASSTAARLQSAGREADAKLRVGDAAAEIIEESASWPADLVVLGSRGLTGLSRLVLGSVARNVLHGSKSSVLIVRETPSADAAEGELK